MIDLWNLPDPAGLAGASRILFPGQRVTIERTRIGFVATGWQRGLPVARRPITKAEVIRLLERYPHNFA